MSSRIETIIIFVLKWSALELLAAAFGRNVAWFTGGGVLVALLVFFWVEGGRSPNKDTSHGNG